MAPAHALVIKGFLWLGLACIVYAAVSAPARQVSGQDVLTDGDTNPMRMKSIVPSIVVMLVLAFSSASAQRTSVPQLTGEQMAQRIAERKGDFDYLLGEWQFTTTNREFGPGKGVWTAVKLDGGSILDEYRVVGDSGETWYHSVTLRSFNAPMNRWDLVSVEKGSGLMNSGWAQKVGDEMHLEQTLGRQTGKPGRLRIRYHNIRPDAFSWTADVSRDGGKTWEPKSIEIEARRIGPARDLPSLAPADPGKRWTQP
ncbi:MAG: hypothetical protein ACREOK_01345 [Gemmatimonadaceae bacterium]